MFNRVRYLFSALLGLIAIPILVIEVLDTNPVFDVWVYFMFIAILCITVAFNIDSYIMSVKNISK